MLFFYVFKMAVAIVLLCENAVEAIQISSISMILSLNSSTAFSQRNTIATALIITWFNIKSCYYVVLYLFWIILPWLVLAAVLMR